MSPEERRKKEREKNAIYSGHLRLCQQPRAAHALRSDQNLKSILVSVRNKKGALLVRAECVRWLLA